MTATANDLHSGFQILWYRIESVLGRGGFGVTYLATDINLGQQVAIKEYLPHEFATRGEDSTVQPISDDQEKTYNWGLERFMSEAQILAKFRHPNIVRVSSVFKHNNTGYMVMEYEHGEPLNQTYAAKKQLTQPELESIYYPIIEGLVEVHKQGFIHRDIKPANIMIREDGSPVLIDFGAARHAMGSQTRTLTAMLTVGYAPFEQYNEGSERQGPWTDIYALSACLYEGVTGSKPIDSMKRGMMLLHNESDPYAPLSWNKPDDFDHSFLRGIDQGLMVQVHDRPQTLEEFMDILRGNTQLEDLPPRSEDKDSLLMATTIVRPLRKPAQAQKKRSADDQNTEALATEIDQKTEVLDSQVDFNTAEESPTAPAKKKKTGLLVSAFLLVIVIGVVLFMLKPGSKQDLPNIPASVEAPATSAEPPAASVETTPPPVQKPVDTRQEKIDELLQQADQFYNDGIYYSSGDNHALDRYQQVLTLDKQHQLAAERVEEIGNKLLTQANKAIAEGNLAEADPLLLVIAGIDRDFSGLKETRNKLAQAEQKGQEEDRLLTLLNLANEAVKAGRISSPGDKSAASYYQQALEIDPGNTQAREGLARITGSLVTLIQRNIKSGKTESAENLLARLEAISPDHPSIGELKGEIATNNKIQNLVRDAEAAYQNQQYTIPESGSSLSLYREVLALSPGHKQATSRIDDIATKYSTAARNAIRGDNIESARLNLDILRNQFPQHGDIPTLASALTALKAKLDNSLLLPVGINQSQGDDAVVESIVDKFVRNFKNQNIRQLKQVAQLDERQEGFFESLFKQYISMNLNLVPASYTINKKEGIATVEFEITELVDKNGNSVITSADWTKIGLAIKKEGNAWLKAEIN